MPAASNTKRLRFRVELPSRCFVLSVAVKLPNAPEPALVALNNIQIERTLTNGDYQLVYDPEPDLSEQPPKDTNANPVESPTAVEQTSEKNENLNTTGQV